MLGWYKIRDIVLMILDTVIKNLTTRALNYTFRENYVLQKNVFSVSSKFILLRFLLTEVLIFCWYEYALEWLAWQPYCSQWNKLMNVWFLSKVGYELKFFHINTILTQCLLDEGAKFSGEALRNSLISIRWIIMKSLQCEDTEK